MPKITILIPGRYRINGTHTNCKAGETYEATHREAHALAVLSNYAELYNDEEKTREQTKRKNTKTKAV